jgi:hypothetical protein
VIVASRIACLLAIGFALLATVAAPGPAGAAEPPAALIDLGGLFGNENEPDENEPEEGSKGAAQEEEQSSGPSLVVVLLVVVLGLLAARVALWGFRLRRRIRNEGWLAVLLGRAAPARRWTATRTDLRPSPRPRRRRSG